MFLANKTVKKYNEIYVFNLNTKNAIWWLFFFQNALGIYIFKNMINRQFELDIPPPPQKKHAHWFIIYETKRNVKDQK